MRRYLFVSEHGELLGQSAVGLAHLLHLLQRLPREGER